MTLTWEALSQVKSGEDPQCQKIFLSTLPRDRFESVPDIIPLEEQFHGPSVNVDKKIEFVEGHSFYKMTKNPNAKHWISYWAPKAFDIQGDPRRAIHFLGPTLARFFGFEIRSTDEILVPTPETLNRRIEVLNSLLKSLHFEPIPVSFYEQKSPQLEVYFKQLALGRIPIAQDFSHHMVHDYSFHITALKLPPFLLNYLKYTAEATQLVFDERQPEEVDSLKVWNHLRRELASSLDYCLNLGDCNLRSSKLRLFSDCLPHSRGQKEMKSAIVSNFLLTPYNPESEFHLNSQLRPTDLIKQKLNRSKTSFEYYFKTTRHHTSSDEEILQLYRDLCANAEYHSNVFPHHKNQSLAELDFHNETQILKAIAVRSQQLDIAIRMSLRRFRR